MTDDSQELTAADFPQHVRDSLEALRKLARDAKSLKQWKAEGRRASADEIALAETQRKPFHCVGTSLRTGLPCTKPRVIGMSVCRKHGGSTKHAIAKAEHRLLTIVDTVVGRLHELAMQDEHKPAAVNAGRDLLDRVGLGAVVQAKVRASQARDSERIVVNIGFLVTPGTEAPIIVDAKPPIDTKE